MELYEDSGPLELDQSQLDDLDTSISKMIYEKIFPSKRKGDVPQSPYDVLNGNSNDYSFHTPPFMNQEREDDFVRTAEFEGLLYGQEIGNGHIRYED